MFLVEWSFDGGVTLDCHVCESERVLFILVNALDFIGANVIVIAPL
jgi:hypothetical protein